MDKNQFFLVGYKEELKTQTSLALIKDLPKIPESPNEAYRSVFVFRPSDFSESTSLKEVSSHTPVYAEFLPIDLDNKDLNLVWEETKEIAAVLSDKQVPYHLFFSGNKGFHILIPTASFDFKPTEDADILKRMAMHIAGECTSFDTSIYNKTRVLRVPFSYNLKGNKYKVPVLVTDTLEDILERSTRPVEALQPTFMSSLNDYMVELYKASTAPVIHQAREYEDDDWKSTVFIKASDGNRNNTAYTVARRLARRGIPEADAIQIITGVWNTNYCSPPGDINVLSKVVSNAYKKGFTTFDDLQSLKEVSYGISDCVNGLISDLKLTENDALLTGYKVLDDFTMGFAPQELVFIAGRSGNFKSAFLTQMLRQASLIKQKPALYFSMEMGKRTLIPRLVQNSMKISKKEALESLKGAESSQVFNKVMDDYSLVKFIFQSNLTTESMMGIIDKHIEKYGQLSAIGIDYLSLFKDCNNNTERTAKHAQELRNIIAKQSNCPVICLVQAKQIYEGNYGDIELDRRCPKDSDAILDLGDFSFGLWGHWSLVDNVPTKSIFGKFWKSRGFDEEVYGENPYFGLKIDKPHLDIKDIIFVPDPPHFKQVNQQKE